MALYFIEVLSSALNARLTSLDGERNADWLHEEPPPLPELYSITGLDVRDRQALPDMGFHFGVEITVILHDKACSSHWQLERWSFLVRATKAG